MTRKELISKLAETQGITKVAAEANLEAFKSVVRAELANGNEVNLGSDFGTFKPVTNSGTIPGTDKKYTSKSVKFSISGPFKSGLNQN